jgi:hypothetical protein
VLSPALAALSCPPIVLSWLSMLVICWVTPLVSGVAVGTAVGVPVGAATVTPTGAVAPGGLGLLALLARTAPHPATATTAMPHRTLFLSAVT